MNKSCDFTLVDKETIVTIPDDWNIVLERIDSTNMRKTCSLFEESPAPLRDVRRAMWDDSIHCHALRRSNVELAPHSLGELFALSDLFGRTQSQDSIDRPATREELGELTASLRRLHELFSRDSYRLPVDFPIFTHDELELGHKLGEGSFSHVHDVQALMQTSTPTTTKPVEVKASTSRAFCALRAQDEHLDNSRYALKQLKSASDCWVAKVDLIVETRILSCIAHPNIIKLRAVAEGSPLDKSYSIVLDRLYATLDQILEMDNQRIVNGKRWFMPSMDTSRVRAQLFGENLKHAYHLATAVEYLHKNRTIHRDIKPSNVGFDMQTGIVKLVDFGLARQLPDQADTKDGRYLLSGMTGSIRYMAPEVYKDEPYTETCDTYSFTLLVWEMLTLKKPYNNMGTLNRMTRRVFERGQRPDIPFAWPKVLRRIMKQGWDHDASRRANMTEISCTLHALVGHKPDLCETADTTSVNSQGS